MALNLSKSPATPPPAKPRASSSRSSASSQKQVTERIQARTEAVGGVFQLAGMGLFMTGQLADAQAVTEHGPNISAETAKLAESNDQIAAFIDKLAAVGPYTGLVMAVLPLALQLFANHRPDVAPALSNFGVKSPEQLKASAQLEAVRQAKAAREAQAEAARAVAEMQAEINAENQPA